MESGRTTISCRFIAQVGLAVVAAASSMLAGGASIGRVQFLPMVPRWSVALSAPPTGPSVITGNLIVVPLQGGSIVALNMENGKEVWKAKLLAQHPVAADADRIYVASRDAIHALRIATGQTVWRTEAGVLTAPPLVHGGWIVAAATGSLSAFRAVDGSLVWRRTIGAVENRPAIDGDMLFVPLVDGRLAGLDLHAGETRWETPLGGAPAEPLAIGDKVYAGASDKRFYALDAADGEIEWTFRVGAAPRGRAAADDRHLYLVAADNILRALDRGHGAAKWNEGLKHRPAEGPLLVNGAIIVPGSVKSLPVFAPDGTGLSSLTFPSTLVSLSNVAMNPSNLPILGIVTGDLENPWTLWLVEASTDPPAIPVVDLTVLPGATIAIALPR